MCVYSSQYILWQWLTLTFRSYLTVQPRMFDSACLSLTDHNSRLFGQSLGILLKSALTCNYYVKLCDSWKRYKTSLWMNIFTQHVCSVLRHCVMERCHQHNILYLEAVKLFPKAWVEKATYLTWIIKLSCKQIQKLNFSNLRSYD